MKQKWELIKLSIRKTTLKYAARKQKSMNNKLLVLEKKLSDNEKLLHQNSIFQDVEEHNLRLRQEINEIMEYKTRGAINRCKANWVEMGEKPTSYFLNKEKARQNGRAIDVLQLPDGTRITHQLEILKYMILKVRQSCYSFKFGTHGHKSILIPRQNVTDISETRIMVKSVH